MQKSYCLTSLKSILLLLLLTITSKVVFAQCPSNIGFEQNDLTNWFGYTGTCAVGPVGGNPILTMTSALLSQGSGLPVAGRIETTSGAGVDPYTVGATNPIEVVCPLVPNNQHSLKIGNDNTGSEAERVFIQFIPTATNNSLLLYYATVLNTGGHLTNEQPLFQIEVFDQNGNLIQCASPTVICPTTTPLPPGYYVSPTNSQVYYSDWTAFSGNLSNYLGQVITIQITTADCVYGGHFGYAYVDLNCSAFTVLNGYCPGATTAQLIGPPGFDNYTWYPANNLGGTPLGTTATLTITAPVVNTVYALVISNNGTIGCPDTLFDTLQIAPLPIADFGFSTNLCSQTDIYFYDSSDAVVPGAWITSWLWNFGDPSSGVNNTSTLQNPVHIFSQPGLYHVSLSVTSVTGCSSDSTVTTSWHDITINPPPPMNPTAGPDVTICRYQNTQLNVTANATYGPYNFAWSPAYGLSNTNIANPVANPQATTTYMIVATGGMGCQMRDTIVVNVNGVMPFFYVTGDDTICPHGSSQLDAVFHSPFCEGNVVPCNGTPATNTVGNNTTNTGQYPSPFSGTSYTYNHIQMLYTKDLLNSNGIFGGTIQEIAFDIATKTTTLPFENFNIKMKCIPATRLDSMHMQGLTSVLSVASMSTVAGWNNYTLQLPYSWDGSSSLLVDVCYNGVNYPGGDDIVNKTTTSYTSVMHAYYGNCTYQWGTQYSDLPNTRFVTCVDALPGGTTYAWTPSTYLSAPSLPNPIAAPLATTNYQLSVTSGVGNCSNTSNINIYVDNRNGINGMNDTTVCNANTLPIPLHVSGTGPAPLSSIPCGANATNCTGNTHTEQVGFGTNQNTSTSGPTPYYGFYKANRLQVLYTKSMLNSMNIYGGTISQVSLNVSQINNGNVPYDNFSINMGCTSLADFTGVTTFVSGLSVVKNPFSCVPVVGWNDYILDNTYDWDGVSNLVVEYCYDNTLNATYTNNDVIYSSPAPYSACLWENNDVTPGCTHTTPFSTSTECPNTKFVICDAPPANFIYSWTPATNLDNGTISNPTASISSNTTFIVTVTGLSGCPNQDTVIVKIGQPISINLPDSVSICSGTTYTATYNTNGLFNYSWSMPNGSLACTNCSTTVALPSATTYLTFTASDLGDCYTSDSMKLVVVNCGEIIVPSAFSPNGDGRNDYFWLIDNKFSEVVLFEVYNRWGQRVYTTNDIAVKGWDGSINGQQQDIGTYMYNVTVKDKLGNIKTKSGDVTLVR